jgi:small subunit ribosomal protein S21
VQEEGQSISISRFVPQQTAQILSSLAGQYRFPARSEHKGHVAIGAEVCNNRNSIATGLGVYGLAEVRIQDGESIENALRRFKRKVQQEDIIKEVKKHSFYLKPGEKKRIKQALARKRSRKKVRREPVE